MSYRPVLIYSGDLAVPLHNEDFFSSKIDLAMLLA